MAVRNRRNLHPSSHGRDEFERQDSLVEEQDYNRFMTANEAFPLRIPLEKAELGKLRFHSSDIDDVEIIYELKTSDILIRTRVGGKNGEPPGTFRIRGIAAADLSLSNEIPGSLEGMVVKLRLEVLEPILFQRIHPALQSDEDQAVEEMELHCQLVSLTSSIHESGHLRDLLIFLKSDNLSSIPPDSLFLPPSKRQEAVDESQNKPPLTFLEGLPFWASFIPWWAYSRKLRKTIQVALFIYTIFSVVWALWQLYRHVEVIRITLQPLVDLLEVYLKGIMDELDFYFEIITRLWTKFLSPLNILRHLFLVPLLNILIQTCTPLANISANLWNVIVQSGITTTLWNLIMQSRILSFASYMLRVICQVVSSSKIAAQSLDITKIRQGMVVNLILRSFRAIANFLAKLIGYTSRKTIQQRAKHVQLTLHNQDSTTNAPGTSTAMRNINRRTSMPIYYSSPLIKQQ